MSEPIEHCEKCRGFGFITISVPVCCGNPAKLSWECCGNAVEGQQQDECPDCGGTGLLHSLADGAGMTTETEHQCDPSVESYERKILRLKAQVAEMELGLKILHDWYGADHEDAITITRTEMGYLLGVHPWPDGWQPRNFD